MYVNLEMRSRRTQSSRDRGRTPSSGAWHVEGQVRGVGRMVGEERYCIDVLQQIRAAQAALDTVALALVDEHVRTCLLDAAPENRDEMQAELMATLGRLVGRR